MEDDLRARSPESLEDEKVEDVLLEHTEQSEVQGAADEQSELHRVDLGVDPPSSSTRPPVHQEDGIEKGDLEEEGPTDHSGRRTEENVPEANGSPPPVSEWVQESALPQPQTTTTSSPDVPAQESNDVGIQEGLSASASSSSRSTHGVVPEEEDEGGVQRGENRTPAETEEKESEAVSEEQEGEKEEEAQDENMAPASIHVVASETFSSPILHRSSHPSDVLPEEGGGGGGAPESTPPGSHREVEEKPIPSPPGSVPSSSTVPPAFTGGSPALGRPPSMATEAAEAVRQTNETSLLPSTIEGVAAAPTVSTDALMPSPEKKEVDGMRRGIPADATSTPDMALPTSLPLLSPPTTAVVVVAAAEPPGGSAAPSVVPFSHRPTSTASEGRRAITRSIQLFHKRGSTSRGGSGRRKDEDRPKSAIISPPLFNAAYATPGEEYHRFRQHYKVSPSYAGPIYVPENVMVVCSGCGGPLDAVRRVPVGKLFFHIHCVHCFLCGVRRVEEPYFQVGNQAVCSNCAEKGDARCVPKEEAVRRNITLGALKGNAYSTFQAMDRKKRGVDASATLNYSTLPNVYPPSLSIGMLHNRRNTTRRTFELLQRQQHYTQNDCNMIFALPPPAPPSSSGAHASAVLGETTMTAITSGRRRHSSAGSRDSPSSSGSRSRKKRTERKDEGGGGVYSPRPPSSSNGIGNTRKWSARQGVRKEDMKFRRKEQGASQHV